MTFRWSLMRSAHKGQGLAAYAEVVARPGPHLRDEDGGVGQESSNGFGHQERVAGRGLEIAIQDL
jgi:hypothetical protein